MSEWINKLINNYLNSLSIIHNSLFEWIGDDWGRINDGIMNKSKITTMNEWMNE